MDEWRKILVRTTTLIREVIEIIDQAGLQIALVTDNDGRLLGTVTDGDIRRGLIKQIGLDAPVSLIMNTTPITANINDSRGKIRRQIEKYGLHHLPILDMNGVIQELIRMDSFFKKPRYDNWVVLMAGGLGTRLKPLTDHCPKPLLKIGSKPVLEIVLENFIEHGFHRFYLAINYKGHLIQDYFGNGSRWDVTINYLCEKERLGTAGALSLLPEKPDLPFFVMNADLMTKVNFQQLLKFHQEHNANATLCVREYKQVIPFGVVHIEKDTYQLLDIKEKPEHNLFVNAGIYVLNPDVLHHMSDHAYFDMPDLFTTLIRNNSNVVTFPIREYWLDIGRMEDLERAHQDYHEVFA